MNNAKIYLVSTFLILTCLFQSCKTYQNVPYFKDVPDSTKLMVKGAVYKDIVVQKGDILSINVVTMDPEANMIFAQNTPVSLPSSGSGGMSGSSGLSSSSLVSSLTGTSQMQQPSGGYKVDNEGNIELPVLGTFKVDGLTTDMIKDSITVKATVFYKEPSISVKFTNLRVNVMGEVMRPGTYVMPNEKNTILDALSMAGDLTIFGKRENLLLIRDSAGYTKMIRFSLNGKDLLSQDFFYLKQNDVIYVEPAKGKAAALDADKSRIYTLAAAVLSIIIVFATRIN